LDEQQALFIGSRAALMRKQSAGALGVERFRPVRDLGGIGRSRPDREHGDGHAGKRQDDEQDLGSARGEHGRRTIPAGRSRGTPATTPLAPYSTTASTRTQF